MWRDGLSCIDSRRSVAVARSIPLRVPGSHPPEPSGVHDGPSTTVTAPEPERGADAQRDGRKRDYASLSAPALSAAPTSAVLPAVTATPAPTTTTTTAPAATDRYFAESELVTFSRDLYAASLRPLRSATEGRGGPKPAPATITATPATASDGDFLALAAESDDDDDDDNDDREKQPPVPPVPPPLGYGYWSFADWCRCISPHYDVPAWALASLRRALPRLRSLAAPFDRAVTARLEEFLEREYQTQLQCVTREKTSRMWS